MTPVLSAVTHPVETIARHVRTTVAVGLVAVLIAALAVTVFDHVPGLRSAPVAETAWSSAVTEVVAAQESLGYDCSTQPRRTDRVVVDQVDGPVVVLPLAEALGLASHGAGTLSAYCR